MATVSSYDDLVNATASYFNTDASSVWSMINQQNISPSQLHELLPTVDKYLYGEGFNSGYTAVKYANGEIASWNNVTTQTLNNAAGGVESALNSNAGSNSTAVINMPANTDFSGTGGTLKGSKGVIGGVSGAIHTASIVSTAVAGLGLGIKLGKTFENALYNANPDFWDNIGLSTLNPATWDSLTCDMSDTGWQGVLKRGINAILGIDPSTGQTQMYIDENMAAYLAKYMNERGVFATGGAEVTEGDDYAKAQSWYSNINRPINYSTAFTAVRRGGSAYTNYAETFSGDYRAYCIDQGASYIGQLFSKTAEHTRTLHYDDASIPDDTYTVNFGLSGTINGKNIYTRSGTYNLSQYQLSPPLYNETGGSIAQIGYVLLYGVSQSLSPLDGVGTQDGATTPDFSGCSTLEDYLQALQNQFPDMFNNKISQDVAQPDGTVKRRNYVPVGTASGTGTQDTKGTTDQDTTGQKQSNTTVNPNQADSTLIQTLIDLLTNTRYSTPDGTRTDTPDNPPDTGTGDTPVVTAPTGQASALWSVYNPTQAQLNSFGAWLWSSNFIDQVLKLFNNPMQSIIGVHKIFATPATGGAGNITVGYLDSGVSANLVSNQYTDINCGSIKVSEQFGNVFDYTDTTVRLYLPFIGIVDLDTSDVMRGTINVTYHVDVITGACLADVSITRDNSGGVLYQFAGDAAVRYPISSGSYIGVVSGIASAIGGVASAVMTGGATLPLAAGAIAGGIGSAKTNVQHSGNFSGNAGAMGAKKPYLIIERPQTMIADGFESYQGKGANKRRTVGQMSGYFKFSDVHTDSINGAAQSEIEAIRAALESGVIA